MIINWRHDAACADSDLPSELWTDRPDPQQWGNGKQRRAIAVCRGCPVRRECLQFALSVEGNAPGERRDGIYGGTTPYQRAALVRRLAVV